MASPGAYKGVPITGGTQEEIQAQMSAIDSGSNNAATSTKTENAAPTTGPGSDAFMTELQGSLMKQSGMISSADSNIEASINKAIRGVSSANEASRGAIESEYSRTRGYQTDKNGTSEQAFFESRTGYGTAAVAFANLREYNAKTIRDLDQRKNELILQGDAAAASKIADLQIKKLDYEQEAAQRTFNNLLSTAGLQLNVESGKRADRAQSFTEKSALGAIALEYGIEVKDGDTIDTVVTRAMPMASEAQKLKLQQIRTSIAADNAQIAKIHSDIARANADVGTKYDVNALAMAALSPNGGTAVLGGIKDVGTQALVIQKMDEIQNGQYADAATTDKSSGLTKEKSMAAITNSETMTPAQKASALKAVESVYGPGSTATKPKVDLYKAYGIKPADQAALDAKNKRISELGMKLGGF
jgi:hypothetical protein